jgi:hypothetical protein
MIKDLGYLQQEVVGKEGFVKLEGFEVAVWISDAKRSFGNLRLLVTPLSGRGQKWVSAERVRAVDGFALKGGGEF